MVSCRIGDKVIKNDGSFTFFASYFFKSLENDAIEKTALLKSSMILKAQDTVGSFSKNDAENAAVVAFFELLRG